jgi:hypothetical protein
MRIGDDIKFLPIYSDRYSHIFKNVRIVVDEAFYKINRNTEENNNGLYLSDSLYLVDGKKSSDVNFNHDVYNMTLGGNIMISQYLMLGALFSYDRLGSKDINTKVNYTDYLEYVDLFCSIWRVIVLIYQSTACST